MKKVYITTTLAYVNADPHIGYALEAVRADAWARWQRVRGNEVFFNTGVDEHGLKILEQARKSGKDPQSYCDEQTVKWRNLKKILNLSFNNFIRTTDERHIKAAQEFWKQTKANGYIYKKIYKAKYCVGCELEKTDSELAYNKCPLHPNRDLEIIEEENYFFRFSAFQQKLLDLYKNNPNFVIPRKRFNEIKKFVAMGLADFSISRLKTKMPWGIEVPDDSNHVIYVWFDALVNYIFAIGWPASSDFYQWWPVIQVAGKDNLRQQSAIWQAMLMAVDLPASKQIFINSFLTSNGQKMSKSLGNVISPNEMMAKFDIDGTRYLLLSIDSFGDDVDISWQGMIEKYNADLANGLGNLVSRVANLLEKNLIQLSLKVDENNLSLYKKYNQNMENFYFSQVLKNIWQIFKQADEVLSVAKPWEIKDKEKIKQILQPIVRDILNAANLLKPFMPDVSQKLIKQFSAKQIIKDQALFPRIYSSCTAH
ncbi:MAG: methionine--tRNA ligase [Patescibacteria group bacterium]